MPAQGGSRVIPAPTAKRSVCKSRAHAEVERTVTRRKSRKEGRTEGTGKIILFKIAARSGGRTRRRGPGLIPHSRSRTCSGCQATPGSSRRGGICPRSRKTGLIAMSHGSSARYTRAWVLASTLPVQRQIWIMLG